MQEKLNFVLVQPARKSGGDKYEGNVEGEDRPFAIYVPQSISREAGAGPRQRLTITIED